MKHLYYVSNYDYQLKQLFSLIFEQLEHNIKIAVSNKIDCSETMFEGLGKKYNSLEKFQNSSFILNMSIKKEKEILGIFRKIPAEPNIYNEKQKKKIEKEIKKLEKIIEKKENKYIRKLKENPDKKCQVYDFFSEMTLKEIFSIATNIFQKDIRIKFGILAEDEDKMLNIRNKLAHHKSIIEITYLKADYFEDILNTLFKYFEFMFIQSNQCENSKRKKYCSENLETFLYKINTEYEKNSINELNRINALILNFIGKLKKLYNN